MNAKHFRLLHYFAEIAKNGSIRGAAGKLGLSPAVVSSALFDLEELVGRTLIRRSTRRMEFTHEGRVLLAKTITALEAYEAVFTDFKAPVGIEGRVSISLPTELAAAWMPTLIANFIESHQGIETLVHADDTKINANTSDHDIAIRTEFCTSRRLGKNGIIAYPLELVCVPDIQNDLTGSLTHDLERIGLISSKHQLRDGQLYCVEKDTQRENPIHVRPRYSINNRQVALDLARQGLGAALLLSISVEKDLKAGRLIRMAPWLSFGFVVARILMLDRRPSPAARLFHSFVLQHLALET
ncbi:MAG: LysR family transcriptional regulator [Pseudomonadota bacterium]